MNGFGRMYFILRQKDPLIILGSNKKSNNLRQKDYFIAKYYQNFWLSDELQFGYQFIYQNNNSWPGYSWNPKDIVTTLNSVILTR